LSGEGSPFVFVFFDLDRFKTVNDALGHRIGDELLSSICQRLNRWLDSAHVFARFGGDEFILFLPSVRDLDEAQTLCLRALDLMREPIDVAGYTLSCGASFGLARYPDHGTTIDALIQAADTAMYHTKSLGTGGCAVFDESMNAERFSQIELEQEMREALAQHAFLAFYQPCVDLVSGEIVAVEALARWQHKRRGLLTPHDFLALANQAGLVAEIDAQVQKSALQ
jgi:diguanylate cyclase (GGDEF)-like protein